MPGLDALTVVTRVWINNWSRPYQVSGVVGEQLGSYRQFKLPELTMRINQRRGGLIIWK
jgi:hypothetical protein